jgi:hypothetical protein
LVRAQSSGYHANVAEGPLGITPPDDTGSTTFRRYRYQAEVAFPFCLDCVYVGNVVSIVPEHVEDLAIEHADGTWRFLQVKTRDADLQPWTLTSIAGSDGGALRSLLRAHGALAPFHDIVRYELRLEGTIRRGDDAERLRAQGPGPTREMIAGLAQKVGTESPEMEGLLARLVIRDGEPSRETIESVNLKKLLLAAPAAPSALVQDVYRAVMSRIEDAMDQRLGDNRWPSIVLDATIGDTAERARLHDKRLTRDELEPLFRPLGAARPALLRRIADPDSRTSALEDKLTAAGGQQVVEDAKLLRANAVIREAEIQASSVFGGAERFDDVRLRLGVLARAVAADVGGPESGARVWARLLELLDQQRETIDQLRLFGQDPMLLLGEVCEMSDLCEFDWGVSRA